MGVSASQLYWITRLDGIGDFLTGLAVAAGIAALFLAVWVAVANIDLKTKSAKLWSGACFGVTLGGCVLCALAGVLTPTTKEAILIYGVPAVLNNPKVQAEAGAALDGTKELLSLAKGYIVEKLAVEKKQAGQDARAPGEVAR